ncbi:hypothetical protein, partial [Escherichia coli]
MPVELVKLPDKGCGRDGLTAILFAGDGRTPGSVNFIASWHQIYLFILYMGLPRSWWEGSERHIQLSVVEHHPQ